MSVILFIGVPISYLFNICQNSYNNFKNSYGVVSDDQINNKTKLLKVKVYFDDNDCFEICYFVLHFNARMRNLLLIMGQILSETLSRAAIGAEIRVSSFFLSSLKL